MTELKFVWLDNMTGHCPKIILSPAPIFLSWSVNTNQQSNWLFSLYSLLDSCTRSNKCMCTSTTVTHYNVTYIELRWNIDTISTYLLDSHIVLLLLTLLIPVWEKYINNYDKIMLTELHDFCISHNLQCMWKLFKQPRVRINITGCLSLLSFGLKTGYDVSESVVLQL